MNPLKLELPWPAAELSPNGSQRWRQKAKAKKQARGDAYLVAIDAMTRHGRWPKDVQAATAQVTFYFPPKLKRHRDGDNHLAMCKPYFDGIAEAGVIANDSGFTHQPVAFVPDADRRVVITITVNV